MKRNLLLFFIVTVSCFTVTEICFKLKKKMYFKISTASSFFYFFLLTPNFYLKMFCYSFQKASENPLVTIDGGSEPTSKLSTIFFFCRFSPLRRDNFEFRSFPVNFYQTRENETKRHVENSLLLTLMTLIMGQFFLSISIHPHLPPLTSTPQNLAVENPRNA